MRTISAAALVARLEDSDLFVLDVREPDEFNEWRIPGAVNIPLGSLGDHLAEIPSDKDVVAVCAVGSRARLAVEQLAGADVDAMVLDGGMGAWADAYDEADVVIGGATVIQVRRRGKGCLSYLVGASTSAIVIDPSLDIDQYLSRAGARGWSITHVVDTHLHADHLSGARVLAAATGATLVLNPADRFDFAYTALTDGMRLMLDDDVAMTVSVLETPGHTMGSTAYLLDDAAIFTGDTLFLESVGRPDLADKAEEFARSLYRSLHDKVLVLPDDALVMPAHFGASVDVHARQMVAATLGDLRKRLPQLDAAEDVFVAWAAGSASPRPPNYVSIVEANRTGSAVDASSRHDLEAGPNRCAVSH